MRSPVDTIAAPPFPKDLQWVGKDVDGVRTAAIVAGAGVVLALLFMPSRHPTLETANAPFEASQVPVR